MHQYWSTPPSGPWVVYQNTENLRRTELLPPEPCIRIVRHSQAVQQHEIREVIAYCRSQRPQDIFLYAAQCTTHYALRRQGLPVIWWNHNAIIDETTFDVHNPNPSWPLMISRFVPFKRIELCQHIPNLRLIGEAEDLAYHAWVRQQFAFEWLNENCPFLRPADVAAVLNQATMLVLTSTYRREGNCRAITEALLTGCPVLYVRPQPMCTSWLTPAVSTYTSPDPVQLAAATATYRNTDRRQIRDITLQKIRDYRSNITEEINQAAALLGYSNFSFDIVPQVRQNAAAWMGWEQWVQSAPAVIQQQLEASGVSCMQTSQ